MSDKSRCPECMGHRGLPRILHDQDQPRECTNAFHSQPEVAEEFHEEPAPAPAEENPPSAEESPRPKPICPYCGADPANIIGHQTTLGPFVIMVVRCKNDQCRKVFGAFLIGMASMGMPPGPPPGPFN